MLSCKSPEQKIDFTVHAFKQSQQLRDYREKAEGFKYKNLWFNSWQQEVCCFSKVFRVALGDTQHPIPKIPGGHSLGGEGNHSPLTMLSLRISVAVLHHPFSSTYTPSREMDMPLKFLLHSITILSSAKDSPYSNNLKCKLLMLLRRFERKFSHHNIKQNELCTYITQSCVCSAN